MKKAGRLNTFAVLISIAIVGYWLYTLRRENLDGDSKAVAYVRDAPEGKFINPFVIYGLAKEQTKDEEKLARIIPLAKSGDREKLIAYLETL
jgi:hypothetical protein